MTPLKNAPGIPIYSKTASTSDFSIDQESISMASGTEPAFENSKLPYSVNEDSYEDSSEEIFPEDSVVATYLRYVKYKCQEKEPLLMEQLKNGNPWVLIQNPMQLSEDIINSISSFLIS